jgi:hypothetical protein
MLDRSDYVGPRDRADRSGLGVSGYRRGRISMTTDVSSSTR